MICGATNTPRRRVAAFDLDERAYKYIMGSRQYGNEGVRYYIVLQNYHTHRP